MDAHNLSMALETDTNHVEWSAAANDEVSPGKGDFPA